MSRSRPAQNSNGERVLTAPSWWYDGPDPTASNLGASRAMRDLR